MTTTLLRITDGTTTLNFSTGNGMKLIKFVPSVAASPNRDLDEEIRVDFVDTVANNRANVQSINKLFEQARNYRSTQTGAKVYLEIDPGSAGSYYRSLIRTGRIELGDSSIGWDFETRFRLTIHLTREPFWEGALTQIPLSNASATGNTSGITITNSYDSTPVENFVDIAAVDVAGDLPAPIKIELEHTKSGADEAKEVYLFHNVYSAPTSFDHILEAEDATGATVTDTADATSSEDYYAALAWTATTETLIAHWSLSSTLVSNAAGGRFAILARWRGAFPYTNAWVRLKLLDSNGVVLWNGNLNIVSSTRELAMLDTLRLPPYLAGQGGIQAIALELYGYRNQSGTHTINLDYLQLSPISGDGGWKRFLSVSNGFAYQEFFTHDEIEGFNYRTDTGAKLISEFSAYGGPIMLIPGRAQRICINSCDKNGAAKVDQTFKVKLWYRPRRNAL